MVAQSANKYYTIDLLALLTQLFSVTAHQRRIIFTQNGRGRNSCAWKSLDFLDFSARELVSTIYLVVSSTVELLKVTE